jgi:amino acid transporter
VHKQHHQSAVVCLPTALHRPLACSEFAAEFPLAGGAYNYISMSLGELPAWLVVTTLILEYILAAAAVARAFSACEGTGQLGFCALQQISSHHTQRTTAPVATVYAALSR